MLTKRNLFIFRVWRTVVRYTVKILTQEVQAVTEQLIGRHAVTDSVGGQEIGQQHGGQEAVETSRALGET